jgi:hypothetical protein
MTQQINIFSYRPNWAARFGVSPFLPMIREEMDDQGWDSWDVILVTGDAHVVHASFCMALIGPPLEVQGFRVGNIAQPDWAIRIRSGFSGDPICFTASSLAIWIR